jgi:hypothetical protein
MLISERRFFSMIVVLSFLSTCIVIFYLNNSKSRNWENGQRMSKKYALRDFQRYECDDMRRIGGLAKFVATAKDNKTRIDGWYLFNSEIFLILTNIC